MKKFVIIAPARSGSRMLTERLASHPDMHVQRELLNTTLYHKLTRRQDLYAAVGRRLGFSRAYLNLQFNGQNLQPVVENLVWGRHYRHFAAAGFKIIMGQWLGLSADQKNSFLRTHNLRVIWLQRQDVLSHFVSTAQAEQHGYRHRLQGQPPLDIPPVKLTLDGLKDFHRNNFVQIALLRSFFSEFESIETTYEDLVAQPDRENERILNFLGVPIIQLKEVLAKNSRVDLTKRIASFETFAQSLRGTAYERLLPNERSESA